MEIETEICNFCNVGELQYVATYNYVAEHFICPVCDSTYAVEKEIVFEQEF